MYPSSRNNLFDKREPRSEISFSIIQHDGQDRRSRFARSTLSSINFLIEASEISGAGLKLGL
jgi:hypothetical protein